MDDEEFEDDEEVAEDEDEEVAEDEDEEDVEEDEEESDEDVEEEAAEEEDEEFAEDEEESDEDVEEEDVEEDEDEEVAEDEEETDEDVEEEDVGEDEDEEVVEDEEETDEDVEEEDVEEDEDEEESDEDVEEEDAEEDEDEEVVEDEEDVEEDEEDEEIDVDEPDTTIDEPEEVEEEEEEPEEELEEEEEEEEDSGFVPEEEEEEEPGLELEEEEEEEGPGFELEEEEEEETPGFELEEEEEEEAPGFELEEEVEGDAPAAAAGAAAADPMAKSLSEIELLERIRRQMFDNHGKDSLVQGQRALQNGSWMLAKEKFEESLKFLQDKESTHGLRQEAYEGLAEAYYRMALDQTANKSYEEAKKSIREARGYIDSTSPLWSKLENLLKTITEYERNPPVEPPPPRVSRPNQKEYRDMREDFAKRLAVAREFYATGEYKEARMHIEFILKKDPYYKPALDLLRKIHIVEHRYADDERVATREGMIKDVTRSWTARSTYGTEFNSLGVEVSAPDPNEANRRVSQTTDEVRVRDKMKNIVLESIEYRQANIVDVINELSDLSREYDSDETAAEEKGINFMLNIGPDTASADAGGGAAASDDIWGEPGEDAGGDGSYAGIPPLTIKARYISLQTALDMIMEMSGLKYRINGNIVMIMRKNATTDEMQHRMYSVLPTIQEVQLSLGGGRQGGSGDQDDPWTLGGGERKANDDWKTFFGDLGVAWPDGSTVKYMPTIGKLVVRNTPDNLATLEQVLGALNVTPFQVEIEVRFVEVSQLDLNSLGLEWILNDDYEVVENRDDRYLPPASRRRGVVEAGSFNRGFNYLNKNTRLGVHDGTGVMDNIATFTSILSNPEFSVVLHALSNRSNTDMLSAPKVTARTGTTATIKTVTEYVYPTEYEVKWPEESGDSNTVILQDGSSGSMMLPAVEPQEFNMREVGVILQVTPNVSSDGTRISLELQPTVVSDPSWKDYGYTYPIDYRSGEGFHLTMEQPFFPVRSLATSVDIYNGCTVVMGGMIREERFTEEDKIPILGDIPLIGSLFRYKYEQSDKRNLLIFVTARLVDPAGREITGGAAELLTGVQSDVKQ